MFSDEFEVDNRTFYPGDAPYWEAVDDWYRATNDMEWYDLKQITTKAGNLRISMESRIIVCIIGAGCYSVGIGFVFRVGVYGTAWTQFVDPGIRTCVFSLLDLSRACCARWVWAQWPAMDTWVRRDDNWYFGHTCKLCADEVLPVVELNFSRGVFFSHLRQHVPKPVAQKRFWPPAA